MYNAYHQHSPLPPWIDVTSLAPPPHHHLPLQTPLAPKHKRVASPTTSVLSHPNTRETHHHQPPLACTHKIAVSPKLQHQHPLAYTRCVKGHIVHPPPPLAASPSTTNTPLSRANTTGPRHPTTLSCTHTRGAPQTPATSTTTTSCVWT